MSSSPTPPTSPRIHPSPSSAPSPSGGSASTASPASTSPPHVFFANDQLAVRFIEEIDFDYAAADATAALITAAA